MNNNNVPFLGSLPQIIDWWDLNCLVTAAVNYGNGYALVACDGGVFNFSNLAFQGSLGAQGSTNPVISIGAA